MHVINEGGQRMSKEWKIGIAGGSCSGEPVVFDFGVAGEFAGYWL